RMHGMQGQAYPARAIEPRSGEICIGHKGVRKPVPVHVPRECQLCRIVVVTVGKELRGGDFVVHLPVVAAAESLRAVAVESIGIVADVAQVWGTLNKALADQRARVGPRKIAVAEAVVVRAYRAASWREPGPG